MMYGVEKLSTVELVEDSECGKYSYACAERNFLAERL